MRRQSDADDVMRCVHALVRRRCESSTAASTACLDADDLAALVAGTLFKTECVRVENHLLVCDSCRRLARSVADDYEAGVVPILTRRATTSPMHRLATRRAARRWLPWLVATLAFVAVAVHRFSREPASIGGGATLTQRFLVSWTSGRPSVVDAGTDKETALHAGIWLLPGQHVELDAEDIVEVVDERGSLIAIDREKDVVEVESHPLLATLYSAAWKERLDVARLAVSPPLEVPEPERQPRIRGPRGLVLDDRPTLTWVDEGGGERYRIQVTSVADEKTILKVVAEDRLLDWPSDRPPLDAGGTYQIRIERIAPDLAPPVEAEFRVAPLADRQRLEADLRELDRVLGRARRVTRALWLRQAGLLDRARQELEFLRSREPSNIAVLELLGITFRELGCHRDEASIKEALSNRR